MTKKERIIALINSKKTDVQPYHCNLTLKIKRKLADYYKINMNDVETHIGNHLYYVSFSTPENKKIKSANEHIGATYKFNLEKINDNRFVDEFGVSWKTGDDAWEVGDWAMIDHPIKNMDLSGYNFPDGTAKGRFNNIEQILKSNNERFVVLLMVGLFDTAWHLTGIQDLLMAMAMDDNNFINKMLDWALEFNIGVIEQMPEQIDAVRFMEDWGQQQGLLMGIKNWKKYIKPRLKEMYAAVKKKGAFVMSHSCGDITELYPHLIELGVDISDPTQPEVMDLHYIKKEYGNDIVLFGGLGCQSTIPKGSPEDVVNEAMQRLELLGKGGKYLIGSSGSIPTETPVENVVALYNFFHNIGEVNE